MAKIFICDQCKKQFPQPLDEIKFVDEHGVLQSLDICAPCKGKLDTDEKKPKKDLLAKIKKEK